MTETNNEPPAGVTWDSTLRQWVSQADGGLASAINVLDAAGSYAAGNVEAALAELRYGVIAPPLASGSLDNSGPLKDAYAAAASARVGVGLFSNMTGTKVIELPAGIFKVTDSEAFMRDLGIARTLGLVIRGAGKFLTTIDFQPSTANARLLYNNDDWLHVSFEGVSFNCSGANAATATFMASESSGGAQNYKFNQCTWTGTWQYGLNLTGSNNNSEMTWLNCSISGTIDSFLYAGPTSTSDQFVNYNFIATDFEVSSGSMVTLHKGGNVNVWGGSLIHTGPATTSTFFNLLGATHAYGVQRLLVAGARIEHRNQYGRTIYSEWGGGAITFLSCDEAVNSTPSVTDNYDTATFGFGNTSGPNVSYIGCVLMGRHTYTSSINGWEGSHSVSYENCTITDHVDASTFVQTSTGANAGSIVPIKFTNCRSHRGTNYTRPFDCTINWRSQTRGQPDRKLVSVKTAAGNTIQQADTATVVLPLDAIITRVFMVKPADGSSASTTWTYVLTDADANAVATLSAGGTTWSGAWSKDSGQLLHQCSTDNRRTLTLSATDIDQRSGGAAYVIEYIA